MSGDGTAVAMNKYHNANPAIQTPSICIIDGDSRQSESEADRVYRLPGEAPESYVFDTVVEEWPQIGGKLSVAVHSRFEDSNKVLDICKSVRRQNMDPHGPMGESDKRDQRRRLAWLGRERDVYRAWHLGR